MSLFERDYIKRLIEQIAVVMAAILGARRSGKTEAGLELIREACRDLLGIPYDMLRSVDPASAALLLYDPKLPHPTKISAYARFLEEEAELHRERGEQTDAETSLSFALALYIESLLVDPAHAEGLEGLERLRAKTDPNRLGERYRAFLAKSRS